MPLDWIEFATIRKNFLKIATHAERPMHDQPIVCNRAIRQRLPLSPLASVADYILSGSYGAFGEISAPRRYPFHCLTVAPQKNY